MLSDAPGSAESSKAKVPVDTKSDVSKELQISMYKQMCLFRRFEERVGLAYTKRKFSGFCHLHIGQEALAVGVQNSIKDGDYMFSGYRSHTQAIGKGITPTEVLAELFGREGGICKGRGGSMHMFSAEKRFMGGHGIVGGQIPLATGVGFAIRYREEDDVCICYMGDAATNQGAFHEALNMAATWQVPVLYIIENNKYGMGTDIRRTTSIDHLWKRAQSYEMESSDVDGMNVLSVYNHVSQLVEQIRADKKPHLLEALTYRYRGHSVSDPGSYRTKEEVREYQQNRDPIKNQGVALIAQGYASEEELKEWDKEAKSLAKDAEAEAEQSPKPGIDTAMDNNLAN